MHGPPLQVDWHDVVDDSGDAPAESMRHRLPWLLGLFALALAVVLARAAQLELADGRNFRELANRPIRSNRPTEAARGSILARDGTPLAIDRRGTGLAIHYRYLESPPNPEWLKRQARQRLSRSERRQPQRVAAMEDTLRAEVADLHFRLARSCQVSPVQWRARNQRIQQRVEIVAAKVDSRRQQRHLAAQATSDAEAEIGPWQILAGLFSPPESLAPSPVVLAEHLAYHVAVDDLPAEVASEIEASPKQYPGVRVVAYRQRGYPQGSLAAHAVGHVSGRPRLARQGQAEDSAAEPPRGLLGIERRFDETLRGKSGSESRLVDHRGHLLSTSVERPPIAGQDVVLSLDVKLQAICEQLLDRAVRRLQRGQGQAGSTVVPSGGAVVILDIHSGEILAAASAPAFDPNWFAAGDARVEAVLADPRHPLFDRTIKMAIPPGSVFKAVTAVALAEQGTVDLHVPFRCQGYFEDPERLRCQLFRQHGIGHGDVTLADALAQSCNVFFFQHAEQLGAEALLSTARRFGLAAPTGVALADEASGRLPEVERLRVLEQLQYLSVGQGEITATPLQIARLYAAIANGGYLVEPQLTLDHTAQPNDVQAATSPPSAAVRGRKIEGVSAAALAEVRAGLERVVTDPLGTGYDTVRLANVSIAGKTGTAENGLRRSDHAWFAGYVPSDAPRYAFVVVLEHGGSGATVAGPVAKSLVQAMQHLGYLGAQPTAARQTQVE